LVPGPHYSSSRQAIVVAFDMCSSSNIVDDLNRAGNLQPLTTFFGDMRRHLEKERKRSLEFELYKFMGDGWLLLFPTKTDGERLLRFLEGLCLFFAVAFRRSLLPHLSRTPAVIGISFGIEKGDLVPVVMERQQEYVGRAINVACRLHAALKDKGGSPAYSALLSDRVYREHFAQTTPYRVHKVTRRLRNIDGGAEFECRRIWLLRPLQATARPS
jgi:class 3 adenylate cyclase